MVCNSLIALLQPVITVLLSFTIKSEGIKCRRSQVHEAGFIKWLLVT